MADAAGAAGGSPSAVDNRTEIPPIGDVPANSNLDLNSNPNPTEPDLQVSLNMAPKQASYAKAVTYAKSSRPPPAFVTNLTTFHPVKLGNASFLKMPEDLYQRRLSAFTHALIGRIFLPKQSPPRPLPDLKSELQALFKAVQDWTLTPLGKGFFSLKFTSQEDQVRASRYASWKLKLGSFFLREWKPNFDPYKEQTSITQIWVRLFHLPEEYWDLNFLVGIFRAVGNVVKLDGSTAAGTVGHFARALVEVDLSYPLADSVTIEGCSSTFVVEFGFENLPLYCSYCRYIGHSVVDCKSKKKADDNTSTKGKKADDSFAAKDKAPATESCPDFSKPKTKKTKNNEWQLKETVTTSNSFTALDQSEDNDACALDSSKGRVPDNVENVDSDPPAAAIPVRELVPLSAEAAAALHSIAGRNYTLHNPETENVLSTEDEEEEEIQADIPPAAAANVLSSDDEEEEELQADSTAVVADSQPDNTTSELPFNAEGLELETTSTLPSPKGSAIPSEMPSTDQAETMTSSDQTEAMMVVPPPVQEAGNKLSAAAKRRAKEALRKSRAKSSMKTRSTFDTSSDILHVLADKRGKSAQVPAVQVGQPHGKLDDKLRTAVEQGKRPTAYVLDTGQSGALKAMEFIAKQRWGDVLDLAKSDKDIYDLTS